MGHGRRRCSHANLAHVPCDVWERSQATTLNRFLAAALAACTRDVVLRNACEPTLSRMRARMSAVAPEVDPEWLAGKRTLDRAEQPFAPVAALARMLLRGVGLVEGSDRAGSGFLVNLESLFERAVVRALRESGLDVTPKSPLPYQRSDGALNEPGSSFQIDALCRGLPGGDLVVDAKYKRDISSANLHQMIAYCALAGSHRAALILPAGVVPDTRTYVFDHRLANAQIRVDIHELATDATDLAGWRRNTAALVAALQTA